MINKKLNEIELEDIKNLIQGEVKEGRTIDYKEKLPDYTDGDKKEFLADISSFANSSGGDLVFGMSEDKGIPTAIKAVDVTDTDAEIRRLENIIRDGIEPRVTCSSHFVKESGSKYILVIRVGKSWFGPHRVIFKGHDKFYARNSAGKYPLDTTELRAAFNLSQTVVERIVKFKTERSLQIMSDNTPVPLNPGGKIILHLIPVESFNPDYKINLKSVDHTKLRPIYSVGWNNRINLDGLLTFTDGRRGSLSNSYVQLYRNGILEAVEGLMLSSDHDKKYIPSVAYEKELLSSYPNFMQVLKDIGVIPPIVVFLTLTEIKGYTIALDPRRFMFPDEYYPIDNNIMQLPETIVESYDTNPKDVLRPMFDLIWNACGLERSFNFDEGGNWIAG